MLFHQALNSKGNYAYNATVYHNVAWQAHFHKNFELIHVLDGAVLCTVGSKAATLQAGDFALCLSNEVHTLHTVGDSVCWVGVFSGDFVHAFEKQMRGRVSDHFVFRCAPAIETYLDTFLITEKTPPIYIVKSCLYAVCHEFLAQVTLSERRDRSEQLMQAITDYIADNYQNKASLSDMAERLGYSYHYLSKCFHKIFGMSFPDFLNAYRLDAALQLLNESDRDIADIALASGFQSIRSFNEVFRTRTGTTPAQYRKG